VAATPLHIEGVFSQFLHRFADRYPNVEVRVAEGSGLEILAMLERGEVHLGQMLPHGVPLDDGQFGSQPLEPAELLVACHTSTPLGGQGTIEVARLAPYPLLLLDSGYGLRRAFDAACRLAGLKPNIRLETRSPHTLLALAEARHGVAVIASTFRAQRYDLKIARIMFRSRPLREPLAILWDRRRPLPRYATAFCQMWAEHVRTVFPITRPTGPMARTAPKQAKRR
jgi:DNA-binding transcriptional LysR family regulator